MPWGIRLVTSSLTLWHHFAPPAVQWCQSACFPMKSSWPCYQVSARVDSICRGLFQQRGKSPAGRSSDSRPDACVHRGTVDLLNHESTGPSRVGGGVVGRMDRGQEVQWCWTITWGLSFRGGGFGGDQEADAWMIQRQTGGECVQTDVGGQGCNYHVGNVLLNDCGHRHSYTHRYSWMSKELKVVLPIIG